MRTIFSLVLGIFVLSPLNLKSQKVDLMGGISTSHFLGDLGGKPFLGTNDLQDLDFGSTRYAVDLGLRFGIGKTFSVRTNVWYARLYGNDKYTINKERRGRNLNFFSDIYEADLTLEANVYRTPNKKKIFYVLGGVGYFHFNPKTRMNGQVYTLRDWGTEGQYVLPGKSPYSLSSVCFPLGFGCKFVTSRRSYLTIEVNGRKTQTDYIDDVSTFYVDPNLIGPTAAALADRNISTIPGFSSPGSIRGDSKDNDNFFFFTFGFNYTLGKDGNFGFGSGKKYRSNINSKRKCAEF